ncbi:MAG: CvpA family protein [Gammaproteobacteria bacterium]|nr:CvpA family protein [Gammaproteobacteria bacterium]
MGDFFDNFWNAISLLVWSDWLTLFILACFIVRGFIQGLAKELISLVFLILAIFLAWLFYEGLANTLLSSADTSDSRSVYGLAFGAIVVAFWLTKRALYKLTEAASYVSNPCALNGFVSIAIFLAVIAIVSWNYINVLADLEVMGVVIENAGIRTWISFAVIYTAIFIASRALVRLLNITIGTEQPCLLAPFFERTLNILSGIDNLLNARNIVGIKNKFLGAFVGLFKGGLFVLIIVLVLQSVSWVSQQYFWIETQGALRTFQDWSVDIKPNLSEHLLFVELEPGDEIIAEQTIKIEE